MSGNSLVIRNNQGWQIQLRSPEGGNFHFQLLDSWGKSPREKVVFLLTQAQDVETTRPFSALLARQVKKLINQNNKFGFQVHKHEGAVWVVFGPYGLSGGVGGRVEGMIAGAAETAIGAVLLGTGIGSVPGAMLISAGVGGGLYAYRTEEKNFTTGDYLKNTGLGLVSGFISGGLSSLNLAASVIKGKVLESFINSTLSNIGNVLLYATVDREEMTATRAFSLLIGGALGSGASHATGAVFSGVLGEVGDDLILGMVRGGVEGSTSGASAAAVATVVGNYLEGKKWNCNLGETVVVGAFAGGISGGGQKFKGN